jgi:hypothetical protein
VPANMKDRETTADRGTVAIDAHLIDDDGEGPPDIHAQLQAEQG